MSSDAKRGTITRQSLQFVTSTEVGSTVFFSTYSTNKVRMLSDILISCPSLGINVVLKQCVSTKDYKIMDMATVISVTSLLTPILSLEFGSLAVWQLPFLIFGAKTDRIWTRGWNREMRVESESQIADSLSLKEASP